ncbi:MAG: hypothetical protein ACREC4_01590 [Methylocella sp.]
MTAGAVIPDAAPRRQAGRRVHVALVLAQAETGAKPRTREQRMPA